MTDARERVAGAWRPEAAGGRLEPVDPVSRLAERLADRSLVGGELGRLAELGIPLLARREVALPLLTHPGLGESTARGAAAAAPWGHVVAALASGRCTPGRRRTLESALVERVPGLSEGERISLARRAPEAVLRELARTGSRRVLRAVLASPRATSRLARELADADRAGRADHAPPGTRTGGLDSPRGSR